MVRRRVGRVALSVFLAASATQAQESQLLFDPDGSFLALTTETPALPQIIAQPQMQVVQPGAVATFSVLALDTTGLSYQWVFEGANVPGATGDSLLVTNVSTNSQGYYWVVLANSSGNVDSLEAPLWIDSRGCGIPDWWQLQYFGNLTNNATGDYDSNGVSNLQKFLEGINPTNSASVRYQLTLFSDGGVVQISPTQSSYSPTDVVTLTATAVSPGIFHAFTGDVVSQSNTVTFTMNTNKTVFARFTPIDFYWNNPSGGDWSVATNWTDSYFTNTILVPLPNDNAHISLVNVTVTVTNPTECLDLFLGGSGLSPNLSVSNTFSMHGGSFWGDGQISGGGRVIVDAGASFTITNGGNYSRGVSLNNNTLENDGTVEWTGAGDIEGEGGVITNGPGALFELEGTGSFDNSVGIYRFDNAGIFIDSANSGTNTVAIPFNNYGTLDIEAGTLSFTAVLTNTGTVLLAPGTTNRLAGGLLSGAFDVSPGSLVELDNGTLTLASGAQLNGGGLYQINGGVLEDDTDLSVSNFNYINNAGGTALDGSGTLTINNVMNWTTGDMGGSGRTVISPGATLNISSPSGVSLSRTLDNGGLIVWSEAGSIYFDGGAITNRPGGVFEAQNSAVFVPEGGLYGFNNAGIFRKSTSTGTTTINIPFNNYGTVDLELGILAANNGYASASSALLNCAIGGTAAGSNYGQLQASGSATLGGSISVTLTNGFLPATNESFTLVSASTLNGAFANFLYPSNQLAMVLSNTATSVMAIVTNVIAAPAPPMLSLQRLSSTLILLSWPTNFSNYQLQTNSSLNATTWAASGLTPVVSGSNFVVTNSLTSHETFFRLSSQ